MSLFKFVTSQGKSVLSLTPVLFRPKSYRVQFTNTSFRTAKLAWRQIDEGAFSRARSIEGHGWVDRLIRIHCSSCDEQKGVDVVEDGIERLRISHTVLDPDLQTSFHFCPAQCQLTRTPSASTYIEYYISSISLASL